MSSTLSDKILKWTTETPSVTQLLEKDPTKSPAAVAKELFGHEAISNGHSNSLSASASASLSEAELERTRKCGKWGNSQPSELFLSMLHAALLTLENDPLAGVVSPSVMASNGVVPLTVIGVVWDICRHMVSQQVLKSCFNK